ncbi:MAG: DUF6056 family protein [Clostridia bacterium]|nr:DUF6056 family protein [Clostridia bacterium]
MSAAKGRWLLWLLGAGLALCMIPLLAGAWGAFPAADDFVFTTRTHRSWVQMRSLPHVLVTAWRYAEHVYQHWQGTFTGVLMLALGPALVPVTVYGVHAWVLLAAFLGALWALVRTVGIRIGLDKAKSTGVFYVLAMLSLLWIPDLLEGLYWFSSSWLYTMAHAAWMLAMTLALRLPEVSVRKGWWMCGLLWAICAVLGLHNYVTAMLALYSLTLLGAVRWPTQRRNALLLLTGAALIGVGLAISASAPGNVVRMGIEAPFVRHEPWLLHAALQSVQGAARFMWRFMMRTPLMALCVLAAPWLYKALQGSPFGFRRPLPVVALAFLGLCAMVIPHIYAAGNTGPARIVNLYFFYCVLAVPFCAAYCLGALARHRPLPLPRGAKPACMGLAAVLLAVALLSALPYSYISLTRDLAGGRVSEYRREILQRFDTLAAAEPDSDMVVEPIGYTPPAVGYLPFMGDPAHWGNEAVAAHYGLRTVRLGTKLE